MNNIPKIHIHNKSHNNEIPSSDSFYTSYMKMSTIPVGGNFLLWIEGVCIKNTSCFSYKAYLSLIDEKIGGVKGVIVVLKVSEDGTKLVNNVQHISM